MQPPNIYSNPLLSSEAFKCVFRFEGYEFVSVPALSNSPTPPFCVYGDINTPQMIMLEISTYNLIVSPTQMGPIINLSLVADTQALKKSLFFSSSIGLDMTNTLRIFIPPTFDETKVQFMASASRFEKY